MARKKHTQFKQQSPLIQPIDMPICIVRPILAAARQATPDMPEGLVRQTLVSMSLNIAEKNRVFTAEQLSALQMNEMAKLFEDDQGPFLELLPSEPTQVITLQAHMLLGAFLLVTSYGSHIPVRLEHALIARLVKRTLRRGMRLTLDSIPEEWWAREALDTAALVWHHAYPGWHTAALRARQVVPDRIANTI